MMEDPDRALRRRFREIARIFGACGECWGYEPDCPECRGRGIPGFRIPADEETLSHWVRPLVNRIQARARRPVAELARDR